MENELDRKQDRKQDNISPHDVTATQILILMFWVMIIAMLTGC